MIFHTTTYFQIAPPPQIFTDSDWSVPFDWVFIVYRAHTIHMTHRFVTYNAHYGYGLYLSKPGVDATNNPDPDNFLLHSNFKQEQVLTAGYAAIGGGGAVFVGFPTVLPSPPLFWMNFSTGAFGSQAMPFRYRHQQCCAVSAKSICSDGSGIDQRRDLYQSHHRT